MKYIVINNDNYALSVDYAEDDNELIKMIDAKDIDLLRVWELAREIKLKKQPSIVIEEEDDSVSEDDYRNQDDRDVPSE